MIYRIGNKLIREFEDEKMQIEAYGKNSLRIRITRLSSFMDEDWALLPQADEEAVIQIDHTEKIKGQNKGNTEETPMGDVSSDMAAISNGKIKLTLTTAGKMIFTNDQGKVLLQEFECNKHSSLAIRSRELKSIAGESFKASLKFESDPSEKLFGMGLYQNGMFDLKGSFLELAQRNSQISIPFVYSSLGYGFLWNNPAVGRASFGRNMTEWEAQSTKQIDFWITAGDSPEEILKQYMEVTGKPPMMPEYGLGFWQCKLRYQTQEELLNVAREYYRRGIPIDGIVIDFFHWTWEGTWDFDKKYWPDPKGMVEELEKMGIKLMVSVWPTVSIYAPDYKKMKECGFLVKTELGVDFNKFMLDPTSFADVTNSKARSFVWDKIKKNYYDIGIKTFWLDVAEPGYSSYDFENYRYHIGAALEVNNQYPLWYTKMIYDGLIEAGETEVVSLVRSAWAGSQRYGALAWPGDIPSTFESFKIQMIGGLQMAMAGIPWWTTDIGGFYDGDSEDPKFRELLIRWFQYGTFSPVMRLHGNRNPQKAELGTKGGGRCGSGADNEIWSFGDENYVIMKRYIDIREKLRPYIRDLMKKSSETGAPVIRPLFYDFPKDERVWNIGDQYMLGKEILVAPVMEYLQRKREVYLPQGNNWREVKTGKIHDGGQTILAEAPLEVIPIFVRVCD